MFALNIADTLAQSAAQVATAGTMPGAAASTAADGASTSFQELLQSAGDQASVSPQTQVASLAQTVQGDTQTAVDTDQGTTSSVSTTPLMPAYLAADAAWAGSMLPGAADKLGSAGSTDTLLSGEQGLSQTGLLLKQLGAMYRADGQASRAQDATQTGAAAQAQQEPTAAVRDAAVAVQQGPNPAAVVRLEVPSPAAGKADAASVEAQAADATVKSAAKPKADERASSAKVQHGSNGGDDSSSTSATAAMLASAAVRQATADPAQNLQVLAAVHGSAQASVVSARSFELQANAAPVQDSAAVPAQGTLSGHASQVAAQPRGASKWGSTVQQEGAAVGGALSNAQEFATAVTRASYGATPKTASIAPVAGNSADGPSPETMQAPGTMPMPLQVLGSVPMSPLKPAATQAGTSVQGRTPGAATAAEEQDNEGVPEAADSPLRPSSQGAGRKPAMDRETTKQRAGLSSSQDSVAGYARNDSMAATGTANGAASVAVAAPAGQSAGPAATGGSAAGSSQGPTSGDTVLSGAAAESVHAAPHTADLASSGPRLEVSLQDATLGDVRIQALMDRNGAMHIDVAGHTQGAQAVLEQITPLLHAAVVQQADAHSALREVHLTSAAVFSQHGAGIAPTTGSGLTALPQGGSQASSLSNQSQSSQQDRRQTAQARAWTDDGNQDPRPSTSTALTGTLLTAMQPSGSSGLSVRI